jgi:hypothetical protein
MFLHLLMLTGPAHASGCSKDTDCKGDRICESGECAAPAEAAPASAAATPPPNATPTATGGCPWAGATSLVADALWDHVTINGVDYSVDSDADRGVFISQLNACNAAAATVNFMRWQDYRDWAMSPIYAIKATSQRDKFLAVLRTTIPPAR